ncbi:MAG: carboxypeptidase regulatory-like domain-containing protein, partial [Acidobacteria bacterium]|nr:carboxypeptidase regulatory-like domain-containing protein [Acidobacteriota bacterium]
FGTAEIPVGAGEGKSDSSALEIVLDRGRLATGRVLDLEERPVPGARVRILAAGLQAETPKGGEPQEATTDSEGRFRKNGLPGLRLDLQAWADGFAPMAVHGVRVPAGDGPVDLGDLLLEPEAIVSGRVHDLEGRPVEGAEISSPDPFLPRPSVPFRAPRASEESEASERPLAFEKNGPFAATGPDGGFRLHGLIPGRATEIRVRATGFLPRDLRNIAAPGPPLEIELQPAAQVSGRVRTAQGESLPGARIHLLPLPSEGREMAPALGEQQTTAGQEGLFRAAEVPPGDLEIWAEAEDFLPSPPIRLHAPAGVPLAPMELVLEPGGVLRGQVLSEDGEAVPKALLFLETASTRSLRDGSFQLAGVPRGLNSLNVRHPSFNPWSRRVDVEPGGPALEILLRPGVEVRGKVVDPDDLPLPDARVLLEGVDGTVNATYSARSQPDGTFSFPAVSDGRYRLSAELPRFVPPRSFPEVTVEGRELADLEIRLRAGGALEGRILGLDFEELAAVSVEAEAAGGEVRPGEIDFEGMYRLDDLAPGDYLLRASTRDGRRQASARVRLEAGHASARRDLTFQDGLVLKGQVRAAGEPLPGTLITLRDLDRLTSRTVEGGIDGRFRLDDLPAGRFRVELANRSHGLVDNREVLLTDDRELFIDLEVSVLEGRILNAASFEPVAGGQVVLRHVLESGEEGSTFAESADSEGAF